MKGLLKKAFGILLGGSLCLGYAYEDSFIKVEDPRGGYLVLVDNKSSNREVDLPKHLGEKAIVVSYKAMSSKHSITFKSMYGKIDGFGKKYTLKASSNTIPSIQFLKHTSGEWYILSELK